MSDDRPITILMPLLGEGPDAMRPVQALRQREDIYVVIGPVKEGEQWRSPPGSMVRRKSVTLSNGKREMVATAA